MALNLVDFSESAQISKYLKIGDVVALVSEESGYLAAEGFADSRVLLEPFDATNLGVPKSFRDCLFKVHYRNQYTAQRAYRKALKSNEDKKTEEEIHELKVSADNEKLSNVAQNKKHKGKVINFGETIQLMHLKSGKFVTIKMKQAADLQKDCFKVSLEQEGDEDSWFNVIPCYKVRSEGEKARIEDQVVLVSAKRSQFLHDSNQSASDGRIEVNASETKTRWKLVPYDVNNIEGNCLKAGDVVAFLHKEVEGYLSNDLINYDAQDDSIFIAIPHSSPFQLSAFNSNCMWLIESESADRGGVATVDGFFRFKHMGSGKYLAFGKKKSTIQVNDEAEEIYSPYVLNDGLSSETMFEFETIDEKKNITWDSTVRIKHSKTQSWLHVIGEYYDTETIDFDSPIQRMQKVVCTSKRYYEDAFAFIPVNSTQVQDLEHTTGCRRLFNHFLSKISPAPLPATEFKAVEASVIDLIEFCTISDEKRPMKRVGLEIRHRQTLLREQKIIPALVDILNAPFKKCKMNVKQLTAHEFFFNICNLTNKLLWQILRNNRENGRFMKKYIPTFQDQIGYKIGTNEVIREIFKDNRYVLNHVDEAQVDFWCKLLAERRAKDWQRGGGWQTLGTISIFFSCEGAGVPRNQNLFCGKLIAEELRHPTKLENGVAMVKMMEQNNGWFPLGSFYKEEKEKSRYYLRELEMFTQICLGRNPQTIEVVSKLFNYNLVMHCIKNEGIPTDIRDAFCNLMLAVHLDRPPQKQISLKNYTRIWNNLSVTNQPKISPSEAITRDFSDLKEFILYYLSKNASQVVSKKLNNHLTLSVLKLCRTLLMFGFYTDINEIRELLPLLVEVMDGLSDVNDKADPGNPNDRYKKTENTLPIMQAKEQICHILHLFVDLRLDIRMSMALKLFKKYLLGTFDSTSEKTDILDDLLIKPQNGRTMLNNAENPRIFSEPFVDSFDGIFKLIELDGGKDRLVPVLLDLTRYDHPPLISVAINLLSRHHSQQQELLQALKKVQILVDNTSIQVYRLVQEKLATLSHLFSSQMNESALEAVSSILKQLTQLLESSRMDEGQVNTENQRLLRNLGAHNLIIELLNFITSGNQIEKTQHLLPICYSFLTWFAMSNPENQEVLFEHINLFLSHMALCPQVPAAITEIFKDNQTICSSVTDKHVRLVIKAIVEDGHHPRYLKILEAMVIVQSTPIKANQNLILNLIFERMNESYFLFNTPEGQAQRNKLIQEEEHNKNPEGILQYHAHFIDLLAKCSADLNEHTEAKCQALLSISEIVQNVISPGIPKLIKSPYLHFLDEVYASTEKKVEELKLRSSLWELFVSFIKDITEYSEKKGVRMQNDSDYIFSAILPLLSNYYWKHYPSDSATEEQATTSKQLAESICNMYDVDILDEQQRFVIFRCLCSFKKRGIQPTSNLKKFEEIIASNSLEPRPHQKGEQSHGRPNTISEHYHQFIDNISKYFNIEGEFTRFVDVYRNGDQSLIEALVKHLNKGDMNMSLLSMKLLKRLIDGENTRSDEEKRIQCLLNSFGASQMIIDFICSPNDELVFGALEFGISLLHGGNRAVQDTMYDYLVNGKQDAFFYSVRSRIQRSKRELKEKRQMVKKREIFFVPQHHEEPSSLVILETSYIQEVLRFLQLLCEGHNPKFQDFIRLQKGGPSGKSIDIVSEIVSYLMELERNIDSSNIGNAIQLFETLTEFIQGPCPGNQLALAHTDLFNGVNNIIRNSLSHCEQEDVEDLKAATIKTLLGLLEGDHEPQIPKLMLNSLALKALAQNMDKIYSNEYKNTSHDKWNENGFLYFMLLRILMDHDRNNETGLRNILESCESYHFFRKKVGRIEIVRDKDLERVYFPILPHCKKLSEKSKNELLWEVDRTSPEKKITNFFERSDALIKEMDHQYELSGSEFLSTIPSKYQTCNDICFILSLLLNVLIVFSYSSADQQSPLTPDPNLHPILFICSIFHLLASVAKLIMFVVLFGPIIISSNWKELSFEEPKEIIQAGRDLLHDSMFFYTLLYLIASFFGAAVSYYFFALHLFDLIAKNRLLQKITQSVTSNAQQLLLTALLGFVIIYHHTIFASLYFREDYVTEGGHRMCDTMLLCLANTFYLGLTGGGISGELQSFSSKWVEAPWDASARFIFDMSYFIIVITILLNIVFGIILDTFADQRDSNNSIKEDIENNCFICNISRDDFDRKGEGFEKHIKNDHNAFQYLYFLVYLKKKDPTEYTGPESYVAEMISNGNVQFFPVHTALCLKDNNSSETSVNQLYARINVVKSNLELLDAIFKNLLAKVNKLTAPHEEKIAMQVLAHWTKVSKFGKIGW